MDKSDEVEVALAMLKAVPVEPPADLYSRCLATIPRSKQGQPWYSLWKGKYAMIRQFAFVCAIAAVIALWTAFPHRPMHRGQTDADVALAQSVKAMQQTPFWHKQVRQLQVDMGRKPTIPPSVGAEWKKSEEWFDETHGFMMRSDAVQVLTLPTGESYARGEHTINGGEGMEVIHNSPSKWAQSRLRLALQPVTPLLAAFVPEANENDVQVVQATGSWKRKAAQVFTIRHQEVNKPWWDFQSRSVLYADPQTGRFMARQVFCRWPDYPDKGEVLLLEAEYDYTKQPDSAAFDVTAFAKGTSKTLDLYPDEQGHLRDKAGNARGIIKER